VRCDSQVSLADNRHLCARRGVDAMTAHCAATTAGRQARTEPRESRSAIVVLKKS
jgi:hypothetical protein